MKMKMNSTNHYVIMFFIMIFSGLLTTMNVWVDKIEDIRFSINDIYMSFLMTGWMFTFMGIVYKDIKVFLFGLFLVVSNFWCIRNQFYVTQNQYLLGMIPHHSMAVFLSKKLIEKENTIRPYLEKIIRTQEDEIIFMKKEIT